MRTALLAAPALALAAFTATPATAQSDADAAPSLTLYELPAYLGRSVTITADTPNLTTSFAKRARSARVIGEWQVCPSVSFAGTCRTLAADTPLLTAANVASARPAVAATASTAGTATSAAAATTVDLDSLDAAPGVNGQDVAFYATPALGSDGVSAGTNDSAAGIAFCKLAGNTAAVHASRARVQSSNLIDLTSRSRVRGFALRDVLCRR